jgi:RNA polymerase sigma-70 factor (ECF subfamily)
MPPMPPELADQFEQHRVELRGYCYRMLGSPFDAEDAVQETFIRAWRGYGNFEGRSSLRSWLYKIATNVCLDMMRSVERRARPMDLGSAQAPVAANLHQLPETSWLEPVPDELIIAADRDPADIAVARDSVRLALVAALQHLPPRQRAALILCEVLQWKATEVAELLGTSVPSVNSALQRARATLETSKPSASGAAYDAAYDAVSKGASTLSDADCELLAKYVRAFEAYDIEALTALIHDDAIQSMPPYDMWLAGRDNIFSWWWGPGIGCKGSRVIPTLDANGCPAFGQYKPSAAGGYEPWALQVLQLRDGQIAELTFFLATDTLFPLFGLPQRLDE